MIDAFRQLAVDLGVDCYVVHQADVPWPAAPCEAYCHLDPTDEMLAHLGTTGDWTGPKPLVCLTTGDLGVFVHELAHAAVAQPISVQQSPLWRKVVAFDFAEFVAGRDVEGLAPWHDHHERFIRAGLHLTHRSVKRGYWWLRWGDVCLTSRRYGTSPTGDYADALGDEPQQLEGMPLAEVLRRPPPREFLELFTRDTQHILETA